MGRKMTDNQTLAALNLGLRYDHGNTSGRSSAGAAGGKRNRRGLPAARPGVLTCHVPEPAAQMAVDEEPGWF